jgi:acyl-CoA synthetase (AMP-forming)/AMP-acid ligase II/carbonic anhydrase/acetyltransferase-like protein (isoleucine patch superfamily)/acyl carrier protein
LISVINRWCAAPINPTSTPLEIKHELESTKSKAIIIIAGLSNNDFFIETAKTLNIGVIVLTPSGSTSGLFSLSSLIDVPVSTVNKSNVNKNLILLLHTSGTSGNKKLVPYTLDMVIVGVACIISSWNLSPSDVCLNMMPLFHIGGIMRNILSPILSGGSVICCSGFDPVLFWDVLYGHRVTWYYAAPTMHHAILQQVESRPKPLPVDSVRFIANAAGGLLPILAETLQKVFDCIILTSYGMTECMPISSPSQEYRLRPIGTSGLPVGPEVIIAIDNDDDGKFKSCATMEPGNIFVRNYPCFTGYENDEAANSESFAIINKKKYFNTGDVGYLDAEGYLFISGRSKEIINRGGETISPFEIEEAIIQHPNIKDCMAFSAKHKEFQETVGIVIVTKANYPRIDLLALHRYCDTRLHRSKWPQVIVYMDALPKNNANKIQRIKFVERSNLSEIDEESSPSSRLYDGTAPASSSLTSPIPIKRVEIDVLSIETSILTNRSETIQQVCVVQVDLPFQPDALVAFIKFHHEITNQKEEIDLLFQFCNDRLHQYLVPKYIHLLEDESVDRKELSKIALQRYYETNVVHPSTPTEVIIEGIWREQLNATGVVSITGNFFDLGGDSLKAGQLVSELRKKLNIQLGVTDLFNAPTIKQLSHKISIMKTIGSPAITNSANIALNKQSNRSSSGVNKVSGERQYHSWDHTTVNSNTSIPVLITQLIPILLVFPIRSIISWFYIAIPWIELMKIGYGRFNALLLAILISRILLGIVTPLLGIVAKWVIIGKYKPGKYPLWGFYYLKWWSVEQIINIMGKGFFRDDIPLIGPNLVRLYYVLLGANIGYNVKIHKDAMIGSVADLLSIGDDVTVDRAILRPFSLEEGHFVLLPITIDDRCSIGVKSAISPGTHLTAGTCIGPLSSSHEADDAESDYRNYCRPGFDSPPTWMVVFFGIPILLIVYIIGRIPWFIALKMMVASAKAHGWYKANLHTVSDAFLWWITPQRLVYYFIIRIIRRCVVPFMRLFVIIIFKKLFIGKFKPLSPQEKSQPYNQFRYWLMSKLLPGGSLGGVSKLVGTHYEVISIIYRLLGAKVGKHVYWPGSGLEIVEYDLLNVGNDVVFGSRSVVMTSTKTRSDYVIFEDGSMIADRCVILPGTKLKRGAVLGSGSLTSENMVIPIGSVWVGSRDGCCINVSPSDPTYNTKDLLSPFAKAFYLGKANFKVIPLYGVIAYNIVWQAICTCYRHSPTIISLLVCNYLLQLDKLQYNIVDIFKYTLMIFAPLNLSMALFALSVDIASKYYLLGKRKQGAYPWNESNYCQNWQLYLTIQEIRRAERRKSGILDMIQGSQYLVWYFRALGSKIGKNVCLYPNGADPMMTEPDLVTIGDHACIDDASLIAHINTRGVFRLNPLVVGNNCVLKSMTRLLSGSAMEKYSILQEHTLVLSGEMVDIGTVWQGWPTRSQLSLDKYRDSVRYRLDDLAWKNNQEDEDDNIKINTSKSKSKRITGVNFANSITSPVIESVTINERIPLLPAGGTKKSYSNNTKEKTSSGSYEIV